MFYVLVLIAALVGFWSFNYVTQATLAVWMVGIACFLGIVARLSQAAYYQRQVLELMRARGKAGEG